MKTSATLPPGREFERELFGIGWMHSNFSLPDYLGFSPGMREVMEIPLLRFVDDKVEEYCPERPNWGRSGEIWLAVKKYLPRRVRGKFSGPLGLFVSVNGTSLDVQHGVDAFFFWQGVHVTLDASLIPKDKEGEVKRLKADFVITPGDMTNDKLDSLGKKVAQLLRKRVFWAKQSKLRKKRRREFHPEDFEEM